MSFSPVEQEEEAGERPRCPYGDLEPGQALLVVQRGPNAGSKFLIDKDVTGAGRLPRERHLPRRRHGVAPPRRDPPARTAGSSSTTSEASTART